MSSPKRLYVNLLASAARTTSGNLEVLDTTTSPAGNPQSYGLSRYARCTILLQVTAASGTTPTLNVYVQKDIGTPGNRIYTDFIAFTQVTTSPTSLKAEVNANLRDVTGTSPFPDAGLATGTANNGPWGDYWRIKWVIAGTTPSFTFRVDAIMEAET